VDPACTDTPDSTMFTDSMDDLLVWYIGSPDSGAGCQTPAGFSLTRGTVNWTASTCCGNPPQCGGTKPVVGEWCPEVNDPMGPGGTLVGSGQDSYGGYSFSLTPN
jgi:hypothetical protein